MADVWEMAADAVPDREALVVGGGNSAAEAALFLSEEGARTTMAIWREDWENHDPKAGAMKHWDVA